MKKIAIVTARGGSKRIPKKNIKLFCGKPMLAYGLDALSGSGIFDTIHVSTESDEVASVAADLGFPPDFLRDPVLADDYTGLAPVLEWVIDEYKKRGQFFDQICCLMPNAPLLQSADLVKAFRIFEEKNGDYPLVVFARFPVPVEWSFREIEPGVMSADSPSSILRRSQDFQHAYYECGPFTLWKPEHLELANPLGDKVLSYIMPTERAVDIDTPEDWEYAESLYRLSCLKT
jgi:pseudaminic acid cytidylyltransferase